MQRMVKAEEKETGNQPCLYSYPFFDEAQKKLATGVLGRPEQRREYLGGQLCGPRSPENSNVEFCCYYHIWVCIDSLRNSE